MSRNDFMAELKSRLQNLPQGDFQDAIMFYEEYFDEAGEDNEQEVINNLGSPAAVAGKIIGEFALKAPENGTPPTTKKSMSTIWLTMLAIFASPIALPIAIAFAAVIFALVISLFAVLFSVGVSGFAVLVAGVAGVGAVLVSLITVPSGVAIAFVGLGASFICIAIGTLLLMLAVLLFRLSFKGIATLAGKFLIRKNKVEAPNTTVQY